MAMRYSSALRLTFGLALLATLQAQTVTTISTTPATGMSFSYQIGAAALPIVQTLQIVSVPSGAKFTLAVTGSPSNGAWLLVSASSGTAPLPLKVQVNPTGLTAGSYMAAVTITGTTGSPPPVKVVPVTLLVSSPPATLLSSPATLSFNYAVGGPVPAATLTKPFVLSSNGTPLTATISVTNAPWLKISPTGSVSLAGLFDIITITIDPTGLTPKIYNATISIAAPASANKVVTLPVALTVNAAVPAALSTWPIGLLQGSPQSIVTLYGSGFYTTSTAAITGFTPTTTITVTDSAGTPATTAETIGIPVYTAATATLHPALASTFPSGVQAIAYSKLLAASGGTGPYTWALNSGILPPGILVAGGSLSGTPTTPGSYSFSLTVTDSAIPFPASRSQTFKLVIYPTGSVALAITVAAAPLPNGVVGTAYNQVLTVSGGTAPYTWTAVGLPPGLTLSAGGVLSGTPTSVGLTGSLTSAVVSTTATNVTIPVANLATAGVLRMAVTTPTPGGGLSPDAEFLVYGLSPQITNVVNSASLQQGTIAPGEIVTILGLGIGPSTAAIFDPAVPPIPTSLPAIGAATSVTIGGLAAPLIYVSAGQIAAIVPYAISGASATVIVTFNALTSIGFTVGVAPVNPGVYTVNASGLGQAAMLNLNATTGDFTVNSSANQSSKSGTVVFYATGAGAMSSAVSNQLTPAAPAVTTTAAVTVMIDGQPATVNYAVAPPGSVPGVLEISAVVPSSATSGTAIPVLVNVGGVDSQLGVTMAVK